MECESPRVTLEVRENYWSSSSHFEWFESYDEYFPCTHFVTSRKSWLGILTTFFIAIFALPLMLHLQNWSVPLILPPCVSDSSTAVLLYNLTLPEYCITSYTFSIKLMAIASIKRFCPFSKDTNSISIISNLIFFLFIVSWCEKNHCTDSCRIDIDIDTDKLLWRLK